MHSLQALATFIMLIVIIVAPLPFGSNRDWSWAPLIGLVGVGVLLQAVAQIGRDRTQQLPGRELIASSVAVGAVVLWAFVQSLPLEVFGGANSFLSSAAEGLDQRPVDRLAIDVERSTTGIMRLLAYCGVFWLSAQLGRNPKIARRLMWCIVLSAVLVTVYGFVMQADNGSCVVISITKAPIGSSCAFSGTFINADNYATFAGLAALVCVAEIQGRLLHLDLVGANSREKLRAWLKTLSGATGLLCAALVVLVGGIFLSGSRAGTIAFLGTCLVMILIMNAAQHTYSKVATLSILIGSLFVLAMLAISGEMLVIRLIALVNFGDTDRLGLYLLSLEAIALHLWTGWGVGSFEAVYSALQPPAIALFYDKAHNTYLEAALELGIPAACLLVLAIALPAFQCVRGVFLRRQDGHFPALGCGATLLVGLHSLVDFSIQIPAVAIVFAALLGLGWAQSRSSRL